MGICPRGGAGRRPPLLDPFPKPASLPPTRRRARPRPACGRGLDLSRLARLAGWPGFVEAGQAGRLARLARLDMSRPRPHAGRGRARRRVWTWDLGLERRPASSVRVDVPLRRATRLVGPGSRGPAHRRGIAPTRPSPRGRRKAGALPGNARRLTMASGAQQPDTLAPRCAALQQAAGGGTAGPSTTTGHLV